MRSSSWWLLWMEKRWNDRKVPYYFTGI